MDYGYGVGTAGMQIRSTEGDGWPAGPRSRLAERARAIDGRIILLAHTLAALAGHPGRIDEFRDVLIDLRIAALQLAEEGGDLARYDTAAASLREKLARVRSETTGAEPAAVLHHASIERQLADLRNELLADVTRRGPK